MGFIQFKSQLVILRGLTVRLVQLKEVTMFI